MMPSCILLFSSLSSPLLRKMLRNPVFTGTERG